MGNENTQNLSSKIFLSWSNTKFLKLFYKEMNRSQGGGVGVGVGEN